jgi:hypothetical protein
MGKKDGRKPSSDQAFRVLNLSDFIEPFNQRNYVCIPVIFFCDRVFRVVAGCCVLHFP